MTEQRVIVAISNNIAHVKFNRADKLNALDMPMFIAIRNTIKTLRKNRDIRAVIVSGSGEDFCSGLDVKSIMKSPMSMVASTGPRSGFSKAERFTSILLITRTGRTGLPNAITKAANCTNHLKARGIGSSEASSRQCFAKNIGMVV